MESIINIYDNDNIIGGGFLINKYLALTNYSVVKGRIDNIKFIFPNDVDRNYYFGVIMNYVDEEDDNWAVIKLNKDINYITPMEIDETFCMQNDVCVPGIASLKIDMYKYNIFWVLGCNEILYSGYPIVDEKTGKVVGMIMEREDEDRTKAMKLTYVRWSKDHYASLGLCNRRKNRLLK